jgi:hypothetical protein
MSKESFQKALYDWVLDSVTAADIAGSFYLSPREVWVQDDPTPPANSRFHTEMQTTAHWHAGAIEKARQTPSWQAVVEESRTWPQLADHIDNNFGTRFRPGTLCADLQMIGSQFLTEPTLDETGNVTIALDSNFCALH